MPFDIWLWFSIYVLVRTLINRRYIDNVIHVSFQSDKLALYALRRMFVFRTISPSNDVLILLYWHACYICLTCQVLFQVENKTRCFINVQTMLFWNNTKRWDLKQITTHGKVNRHTVFCRWNNVYRTLTSTNNYMFLFL